MSKQVKVASLPRCDFCGDPAEYDGKTIRGGWANMCPQHFCEYGTGLGTGKGQKLIVEVEVDVQQLSEEVDRLIVEYHNNPTPENKKRLETVRDVLSKVVERSGIGNGTLPSL